MPLAKQRGPDCALFCQPPRCCQRHSKARAAVFTFLAHAWRSYSSTISNNYCKCCTMPSARFHRTLTFPFSIQSGIWLVRGCRAVMSKLSNLRLTWRRCSALTATTATSAGVSKITSTLLTPLCESFATGHDSLACLPTSHDASLHARRPSSGDPDPRHP